MKRTRPPQYRHELKYFINQGDYTLLSGRLQKTMAADAYAATIGEPPPSAMKPSQPLSR